MRSRATVHAAGVLLLLTAVLPVALCVNDFSTCDGCTGRGSILYTGLTNCLCLCDLVKGTQRRYVGPSCKYSVDQTARIAVNVSRPLSELSIGELLLNVRSNLALEAKAELEVIRATNYTVTCQVVIEFRHDVAMTNGAQFADKWANAMVAESSSTWAVSLGVSNVAILRNDEAPIPVYPVLGEFSGFGIPTEPVVALALAFVIAFVLYAQEIILTSNFVVGDGEELMEALRVKRRREKEVAYEPSPAPVVAPEPPRAAWLENEAPAPIELPTKKKTGQRSFADYADSFFASA